jgi:hypothetical protein
MMVACYDDEGVFIGAVHTGGEGPVIDSFWTVVLDEKGNRYLVPPRKEKVARRIATGSNSQLLELRSSISKSETRVSSSPPTGASLAAGEFESVERNSNGAIEITFRPGETNTYVVEATTDLEHWMPVTTNTLSGGVLVIRDYDMTTVPSRFFRVRRFR